MNDVGITKADRKLITICMIGSLLEYFDFMVFIFITPIIIKVFLPNDLHGLEILFTYSLISISYFVRPIGGILMGHLSDKYSRRTIFWISLLLMAVPSLVIGLLPTFNTVGYMAPILLIMMRVLQGISLGAEVPASISYMYEKYSQQKTCFFYLSWLTFGANFGVASSSLLTKFLITNFSSTAMLTYGWRLPFLLGGSLAFFGFYLRKILLESQEFKELQNIKRNSSMPLKHLFKNYIPQIICGIAICAFVSISTSLMWIFLPNLLVFYHILNMNISTNITVIGSSCLAIFSVLFGYLTKFIKPNKIISFTLTTLICFLLIVLLFIDNVNMVSNSEIYIFIMIFAICISAVNGLFFGLLAEMFDRQIRFSGIAICYNVAYILGAGLTPFWANVLVSHGLYLYAPIIILLIAILLYTTFKPNISYVGSK